MTSTAKIQKNRKKKQKLRNNEYYSIQYMYDELYSLSQKGYFFNNIYEKIVNRENILLAYRNIKKNTGSKTSGVNRKTISDMAIKNDEELVRYVQGRLNKFEPMPVIRVTIPKGNGGTRPLGIPTL